MRIEFISGELFTYTILGFALVEAIALFALMVAFLILYAFQEPKPNVWSSAKASSIRIN